MIIERTTPELSHLDLEERARMAALPATREDHVRLLATCAPLHEIELRPPPRPPDEPPAQARVAFWNAERLKHLGPSIALLRRLDPLALLLCELDLGMARSGQRHTCRELAEALGMGSVFGVEFVELGLGNASERARHAGADNRCGLHGNAILSPLGLARPRLVRLDRSGAWFDGRFGERRIGGRMAMLATLRLATGPVTLASVHLESHGDPASRAVEMRTLLDAIEAYAPGVPALIGGDLNTASAARDERKDPLRLQALLAADPGRLIDPVAHEPLFEVAAAAGYSWREANDGAPTQRTGPDGSPPPLGRLDWYLARGLLVRNPRTVPAVDAGGEAISDHDVLVVEIAHPS